MYKSHYKNYKTNDIIFSFPWNNYHISKSWDKTDLCNKNNDCLNSMISLKSEWDFLYVYMTYREFSSDCKNYCVNLFWYKKDSIEILRKDISPQYLKLNISNTNFTKLYHDYNDMNTKEKEIFEELEKNKSVIINWLEYN